MVVKFLGLAVVFFLLSFQSHLLAALRFRPEYEITDLSVKAFSGDKAALEKIKREFKRYREKIQKGGSLTEKEKEIYGDISDTLDILAPGPAPEPPKDYLLKPKRWSEDLKDEFKVKLPYGMTKYFEFGRGALQFAGRSKAPITGQWRPNDKRMTLRVLAVENPGLRRTRVLALEEILAGPEARLARQTLVTYDLSSEGVRIERETAFDEPAPGLRGNVGNPEGFWLVKFPLEAGSKTGDYRVESLTDKIRIASQTFSRCLVVLSPREKLVFAPGEGLLAAEVFDEQWLREEASLSTAPLAGLADDEVSTAAAVSEAPVSGPDLRKIYGLLSEYCRSNGYALKFLLSIRKGDAENSAVSKILVYKADSVDPAQKKFEVLKQTWLKRDFAGYGMWGLEAPPEPAESGPGPKSETGDGK